MSENYELKLFGTRGSYSVSGEQFNEFGGYTSCFVLKKDKYALIIDCGTGLYGAKDYLADCEKIDVLLTHLHYDHILGLLYGAAIPANADVNFYGTFDKWRGDKSLLNLFEAPYWPYVPKLGKINNINNEGNEYKLNDIAIKCYPSVHPNECTLYSLLINNKKICILFDLEYQSNINLDFTKDADMVLFDGMYDDIDYKNHIGWGHSTWQEGCRLANKYAYKKLIITHHNPFSSDKTLRELESKCKELYKESCFAREKDTFIL